MSNKIRWLFFDIGSTLVDEHLVYEHIFRDIANTTGISYEEIYNQAQDLFKQNKKGDCELCKKYNLPKRKWHIQDEILYKDASRYLEKLSAKYKIGIIANQSLGTKNRLKNWGLDKYIDLIIASFEEGVSKPDPQIFKIALQRANCNPDQAVMIGDRIDNDIIPAKKLGIHTIWIKQGFGGYWTITKDEEKAEFVARNLWEVCNYLI